MEITGLKELTLRHLKTDWFDYITSGNPLYHLSITFTRDDLSVEEAKGYIDLLLRFLNNRLFNRQYRNGRKHLKGFAFVERQLSGAVHYHILLFPDAVFLTPSKPDLLLLVLREAKRIKKINRTTGALSSRSVFSPVGIALKKAVDTGIVSYALKTLHSLDEGFIGILGSRGITWGDLGNTYIQYERK